MKRTSKENFHPFQLMEAVLSVCIFLHQVSQYEYNISLSFNLKNKHTHMRRHNIIF